MLSNVIAIVVFIAFAAFAYGFVRALLRANTRAYHKQELLAERARIALAPFGFR